MFSWFGALGLILCWQYAIYAKSVHLEMEIILFFIVLVLSIAIQAGAHGCTHTPILIHTIISIPIHTIRYTTVPSMHGVIEPGVCKASNDVVKMDD